MIPAASVPDPAELLAEALNGCFDPARYLRRNHPEEIEWRAEDEAFQIRHGALVDEAEAVIRGG